MLGATALVYDLLAARTLVSTGDSQVMMYLQCTLLYTSTNITATHVCIDATTPRASSAVMCRLTGLDVLASLASCSAACM